MNLIDKLAYDLAKANERHNQNTIDLITTMNPELEEEPVHQYVDPTPSETKPTNPKDACGIKKVPISGLPAPVILEAGLVKLHGDLKYGRYNWRDAGVRGSVSVSYTHLRAHET